MRNASRRSPIRNRSGAAALALVGAAFLLTGVGSVRAQVRTDARVYAMAYAWERPDAGGQRVDSYEGLQLRVRPQAGLDFRFHGRIGRRGHFDGVDGVSYEWDERIYELRADARLMGRALTARIGRQFLYRGVVNGTFDGASLRLRKGATDTQVLLGSRSPFDRALDVQSWDDGGTIGIYSSATIGPGRVNASWVRQQRGGDLAWHQAGLGASYRYSEGGYLQSEFDYNLEQSTVQRFRVRGWHQTGKWIVTAEGGMTKPRIYEDSPFAIFELEGFSQIRGGVSYDLGPVRAGVNHIYTAFSEDGETSNETLVTASNKWGTLGGVIQSGFGGERLGLYADARARISSLLTVRARTSYLEYQRRSLALTDDATAFSAGVELTPTRDLSLRVEAQQSQNRYLDSDFRVFARISYAL